MRLLLNAVIKYICGVLLVGALVFLPAGTFNYIGGLCFMALLFIPIFILGVVLFLKSPDLLEKRLDGKEKEKTQKGVVAFSGLVFIVGFITAGLDFRFGWTKISMLVRVLASALCMDKVYAKTIFKACNINVAKAMVVKKIN